MLKNLTASYKSSGSICPGAVIPKGEEQNARYDPLIKEDALVSAPFLPIPKIINSGKTFSSVDFMDRIFMFLSETAKSVSESLSIDESNVWVVVEEFPSDEWGLGGELACDKIKASL